MFKLGYTYSVMGADFTDKNGDNKSILMDVMELVLVDYLLRQ